MFVIVEIAAAYCPSTDAIIGQTSRIVEAGILTPAWAAKRAGILSERDQAFGDSGFYARPASDPFNRNRSVRFGAVDAFDDCPF